MVHCSIAQFFCKALRGPYVEPSPAQTLHRTPRTLTTTALPELHRNLTHLPHPSPPEPPGNFRGNPGSVADSVGEERALGKCVEQNLQFETLRWHQRAVHVSWWTQATGRYTQRREWRKRSRAFVSCGDLRTEL